ncbi:hypothetical protein N7530_009033 [Penicillium desertorum]|uniref:Uncharacterized protein n=1 Tax=Penicillium desertorum TaxID=1303715 RepID=A0A9W9WQ76_9EURO|nr:hypothetical protein N7530_009033 [Penicillium desertorum]
MRLQFSSDRIVSGAKVSASHESPILNTEARHPDMSDDTNPIDSNCFDALPVSTFEAIGSSAGAIRKIIKGQTVIDLPPHTWMKMKTR